MLNQDTRKTVKGYWTLSDRVLLLKIVGKPLDLNITQIYAPTSTSNDEDKEMLWRSVLEQAKAQCKQQALLSSKAILMQK